MLTPIRITKSSHIKAASYDPMSKTLVLRFDSERSYHFANVPADVVDHLQKAKSPGAYFAKNIKEDYDMTVVPLVPGYFPKASVADASLAAPPVPDKPSVLPDVIVHVVIGLSQGQPALLEVHIDPVVAARRKAALEPVYGGASFVTMRAVKVIG